MKILGIPVRIVIPKLDLVEIWGGRVSNRFNGLPPGMKRQLVLLFLILSNFLCGYLLLRGLKEGIVIAVEVPVWEPPLIYHDSIIHKPLNQLFYETTE